MDNKKVTRRAVIGTAIGAVAVSPFIIRALKGRYQVEVPEGKYKTEWEKFAKILDVPIKDIEEPSTPTLARSLREDSQFRVFSLRAVYDSTSYPAKYPQPPSYFDTINGLVAVVSPIVKDKPALLVKAEKQTGMRPVSERDVSGGECVFVPRGNGELDCYQIGGDTPKKLPAREVNPVCAQIARRLTIRLPEEELAKKGMKWSIPATWDLCVDMPCKIVGFAEVSGYSTAKVLGEKHLDNQEFLAYLACSVEREKELVEPQEQDTVVAGMQEFLERTKKERLTRTHRLLAYVDLETGLAVRQEHTTAVHTPRSPHLESTTSIVSQMFES